MKKGYWRQKDFCCNINRHPMTHREEYDGSTAEKILNEWLMAARTSMRGAYLKDLTGFC